MTLPIFDYNQFIGPNPQKAHAATHMFTEGAFPGHSSNWIVKIADDPIIARHEVLAQELFRLFIPHQPQTRIAKDEKDYFVCSEKVESYKSLPYGEGKRFEDGTYTGLGQAILVAVFLQEVDLKNGNIGLDKDNRVIKIDGDQCLASVLEGRLHFALTPEVIATLPRKGDFAANNWLDDKSTSTSFSTSKILNHTTISKNELFRGEINQAMLKICLLPDEYIERFVALYIPEENGISRNSYIDLIKNRRDTLKLSAVQNDSFRHYLYKPEAQDDARNFLEHMRSFQVGGESVIPMDYALEVNSTLTELQKASALPMLALLNEQLEKVKNLEEQPEVGPTPLEKLELSIVQLGELKKTLEQELSELVKRKKTELNHIFNIYIQIKKQELFALEAPSTQVQAYKVFLKQKIIPILEEYILHLQESNAPFHGAFPEESEWTDFNFTEAGIAKESINIIKLMIKNEVALEEARACIAEAEALAKFREFSQFNYLSEQSKQIKGVIDTDLKDRIEQASVTLASLSTIKLPNQKEEVAEKINMKQLLADITKQVAVLENNTQIISSQSEEYLAILERCLETLKTLKERSNEQNKAQKNLDSSVVNDLESRLQKIKDNIAKLSAPSVTNSPSELKNSLPPDANIPPQEKSLVTESALPSKFKVKNRVIRIPTNEREENIFAVGVVLNDDDLMKGTDNAVPSLIQDIRNIVNAIDCTNEDNISESIISIQERIRKSHENQYPENIKWVIDAFNHANHLSFREIRLKLEENSSMKEIMDPIKVGMSLN
ncbi:SidE protein, substrate of the Dot/Icm system [Legionella santicrucis]|uniref:SidE protein, substrate of the Dot/Icm system n=1 Tax=Legionella santicrucis TaxID=45074 RepID=A0A0W0YFE9_9GAMM|nr:SidE phosphodiesterase domain-containing protein [Legionella santicrucis]KTD55568.1 SidE protein, substrate of the Dot/Icm system [Legionella santicrucis]